MRRPSCRWSSLVHPVASRTIITPIDLSRANQDIAARRHARATIVLTEVIPVWFLLSPIAPSHAFLGEPLQRLAGCYVDVFRNDIPEVATVDRSTEVRAMQPPDGVFAMQCGHRPPDAGDAARAIANSRELCKAPVGW